MRVAFFTFPSAFQNFGGGEVQLLKTKAYLEKEGVVVDLFDPWRSKLEAYDILHVFSSAKECLGLVRVAQSRNVKVVNSPVFWSDWKRGFFTSGGLKEKANHTLRHAVKWVWPTFPSQRRDLMRCSDLLLVGSEMEKNLVARLFALPKNKMRVVHNAVDAEFAQADPALFQKEYGARPFILNVARFEEKKNQLNLIRAVKSIPGQRLFIIGNPVTGSERYYDACREEGKGFTTFLPVFPHESQMLRSAYAACEVFVLPAWHDIPGLVVLEAGLAGAKVIATTGGSTREYFKEYVDYLNPMDVNDIRSKIILNLAKPRTPDFKKFIVENYTWDRIAKETLGAYKELLEIS